VKKLKITQVKSTIGKHFRQKRTIRALGLKRMHDSVIHSENPQVRGMINRVSHLVRVEEIEEKK
jgi:large subunit ribosomal protein L30